MLLSHPKPRQVLLTGHRIVLEQACQELVLPKSHVLYLPHSHSDTVGTDGLPDLPGASLCPVTPLLINIQCFLSSYKTKPVLNWVLRTLTPRRLHFITPPSSFVCASASHIVCSPFLVISSVLLSRCFHSCCFFYWNALWISNLHVHILFSRSSSNFDKTFTSPHTALDCLLGENDCPRL